MGYRRVNAETLHEILQRLRAGDSNRRIAVCARLGQEDGQPIRRGDRKGGGAGRIGLPRNPRPACGPAQRKPKAQTCARRPGAVGGGDSVADQWQQGGASGPDEGEDGLAGGQPPTRVGRENKL